MPGYCAAYGKALQDFLGSDEFGFSILYKAGMLGRVCVPRQRLCSLMRRGTLICRPFLHQTRAAGSSKIDIGVPKQDVVLAWATISDYVQQCRWSRVLGGVHFEVRFTS